MKAVTNFYLAESNDQCIYQLFEEYLNNVYYDGYAIQLAEESPETFEFELTQFIDNY